MDNTRSDRLEEITNRYPRPHVVRGVTITTTQAVADLWWLLDQLALLERTIVRVVSEREQLRARAAAAEAKAACLSDSFDPARMADVFFNGRKA